MTRRIAQRYDSAGYAIITYRQEPDWWYVASPTTRRCKQRHRRQPPGPHEHTAYRRAILPPFRSYGRAVIAAHELARPPPHINAH